MLGFLEVLSGLLCFQKVANGHIAASIERVIGPVKDPLGYFAAASDIHHEVWREPVDYFCPWLELFEHLLVFLRQIEKRGHKCYALEQLRMLYDCLRRDKRSKGLAENKLWRICAVQQVRELNLVVH